MANVSFPAVCPTSSRIDDLWWFLMMFDDVLRSFWCCNRWSEKDMFDDCWRSLMICWWRNPWFCWVHFRQPPYVGFEPWGLRSYIPTMGFHKKLDLTNTLTGTWEMDLTIKHLKNGHGSTTPAKKSPHSLDYPIYKWLITRVMKLTNY